MTKKRSVALRDTIEEDILLGRLVPGCHLDETTLSKRFSVSRTPVREALMQLAAAGLVELRPRRGAMVSEITVQRLYEMSEVMGELEGMCGRLAARRMSPGEHAALIAAHKALEEAANAQDCDAYFDRNEHFHELIYAGSHNSFLTEQARMLRRRLRPYRRLKQRVINRIPSSFSEHKGIVTAIISGDSQLVADLLRSHITVRGERFGDLVAIISGLRDSRAGEPPLEQSDIG